jgi:hypothetical protein
MKVELGSMVDLSSDPTASRKQISSILMAAAGRFVDRLPT